MPILDKLKRVKKELLARPHPLVGSDISILNAYIIGVGILAAEDTDKMNQKELEFYEALHYSMKMPEGSFQKNLINLEQVSEGTVKEIVEILQNQDYKFLFILDLFMIACIDGEIVEKEFELIQIFCELLKISPNEKIIMGQFSDAARNNDIRSARSILDPRRSGNFRLTPQQFSWFFPSVEYPQDVRQSQAPEVYIRKTVEFSGMKCFAFSPDLKSVAFPLGNAIALKRPFPEEEKPYGKLNGHSHAVNAIAISPLGRLAASGGGDGNILLWDMDIKAEVGRFQGTGGISAVAISPDGRLIASGGTDKSVRLFDVETRRELQRFEKHDAAITTVAFSPDERFMACGSCDSRISIWKLNSTYDHKIIESHTRNVNSVAFSIDGKTLATGGNDSVLRFWEMEKMTMIKEISFPEVIRGIAYSPDGKLIAIGGNEGRVFLLDSRNYSKVYEFLCFYTKNQQGDLKVMGVCQITFSLKGEVLGVSSYEKVTLWKLAWV